MKKQTDVAYSLSELPYHFGAVLRLHANFGATLVKIES
jgi:hypothetical protein